MTLAGDVDFQQIAKKTPGFVGADLSSLTKEAAVVAINRIFTRLRATRPPPITGDPCSNENGNGGAPGTAHCAAPPAASGKPRGGEDAAVAPANPEDSGSVSGAGAAEPSLDSVVGDASGSLTTSPSSSTAVQQGKKTAEVVGAGAEDAAEAVGGFLAGPLSAAQLAPLSVTMEDFLTAVKKVIQHTPGSDDVALSFFHHVFSVSSTTYSSVVAKWTLSRHLGIYKSSKYDD